MSTASPSADAAGTEGGGEFSTARAVGVLVAIPSVAGFIYLLGGLSFTVQAQQVGLPWRSSLSLVDTRTLLVAGARTFAAAVVMAAIFTAGVRIARQVPPGPAVDAERHPTLTAALGCLGRVAVSLLAALATVFAWAVFLTAIPDFVPVLEPLRWGGVVVAIGIGLMLGWKRPGSLASRRGLTNALVATAALASALFMPAYLATFVLVATGSYWFFESQAHKASATSAQDARVKAVMAVLFLLYALQFMSARDLQLDTVAYPAAPNHRAGLLVVSGDYDALVLCDPKTVAKQSPRVIRVPHDEGMPRPIESAAYRVPLRGSSTLLSVIGDKSIESVAVDMSSPDICGR